MVFDFFIDFIVVFGVLMIDEKNVFGYFIDIFIFMYCVVVFKIVIEKFY